MQSELFHEDLDAALVHVIAGLGGNQKVGHMLWPEESPDAAGKILADCMNPDRPRFLKGKQILLILTEARRRGIHSAMAFINNECGYEAPNPVEPEDERAKLQRQYIEATRAMGEIVKRMEKLEPAGAGGMRVVS